MMQHNTIDIWNQPIYLKPRPCLAKPTSTFSTMASCQADTFACTNVLPCSFASTTCTAGYVCVCIWELVRERACMCVCMYACLCVCMFVCMYACVYVRMCVCMYECMCVCMIVCTQCIYAFIHSTYECKYVRVMSQCYLLDDVVHALFIKCWCIVRQWID